MPHTTLALIGGRWHNNIECTYDDRGDEGVSIYVKITAICGLEAKICKLVKNRVRTQGHGILEPYRANISCAQSFMSVYEHFLLLDCVRQMIIFTSNVFAVQSDPPTPPSIYFHHNWAGFFSPICISITCNAAEQMSGGVIHTVNTSSPPHLP